MLQIRFKLDCRIITKPDYYVVTYTSEIFINCISFFDTSLFAAANEFYIFLSACIFFQISINK